MGSSPTRSVIFAPGSSGAVRPHRGQPQPGHPALGAAEQLVPRALVYVDAQHGEVRVRLVSGAGQVRAANVSQLAGHPQPGQLQGRRLPGGQHQPQRARGVPDDQVEPAQHGRVGQFVHVVQDEHHRLGEQLGHLDQAQREPVRAGVLQRAQHVGRDGAQPGQRRAHVGPEPGLLVLGVHRQPGHPAALRGRAGPGGAGHRLARAGRPADQRDPVAGGLVEQAGDAAAAQHREVRLRDLQLARKKPRRPVGGGTGRPVRLATSRG